MGVAAKLLEKRAEIEAIFAEHDLIAPPRPNEDVNTTAEGKLR